MAFITNKEQNNIVLTLKLQKKGKITTPKALFEALTKQEINGLTKQNRLVKGAGQLLLRDNLPAALSLIKLFAAEKIEYGTV